MAIGAGASLAGLSTAAGRLLNSPDSNIPGVRAVLQGIQTTNSTAGLNSISGLGTASYTGGVAAVSSDEEVVVTGTLSLNADFGSGTVTGGISGVRVTDEDVTDFPASGTIALSSGAISNSGGISANLGGPVSMAGQTLDVSGRLTGEFRGANAARAAGGVTLNATNSDGLLRLDGGFSATRN